MTDYIIPELRQHAVPVGDLRLDPANANTHPEKNLNAIKDSLAAFGQRQVVLARKDTKTVIAGNGRLLAVRKGATGHYNGDRTQSTVWDIPKPQKSETGHSTQKPVECMRRPILNNSLPGEAIYEPFSGSGTTIIAAEETGRSCYAIELNPAYVDVAINRWQNFTGEKAVHEDGRVFDELSP